MAKKTNYLSPIAKQEWDGMQGKGCPKCKGGLKAVKIRTMGFGGAMFKWKCIDPDCSEFNFNKTSTQIQARYMKKLNNEDGWNH